MLMSNFFLVYGWLVGGGGGNSTISLLQITHVFINVDTWYLFCEVCSGEKNQTLVIVEEDKSVFLSKTHLFLSRQDFKKQKQEGGDFALVCSKLCSGSK